jgi:hypothetical protein
MVQSLREPSEVSMNAPFLVPTSTLTLVMIILSCGQPRSTAGRSAFRWSSPS